ncbi:MAG: DUF58 domain-containing protein [Oceanicoccus sp.]
MLKFFSGKRHAADVEQDHRVYAQLPELIKLQFQAKGFSFLPKQPAKSLLTGRHSSKLRGRGLNFEELRHYRSGDDIRTMDWKVTNRTRKPHVRVYTEERERNVILFVDMRISMFFGSEQRMKSVAAAEAAALAAWRIVDVGDRVGAVIFNDDEIISITPARSRTTVLQILSQLANFSQRLRAGQRTNPGQLNTALKALSRNLSHDALVISVGDGAGWNKGTTDRIKKIAQHNDIIAIKIFDRAEEQLPAIDHLIVSDGQLQVEIRGKRQDLRKRFQETYDQQLGMIRYELKKHGIPVIDINTNDSVQRQLVIALGGFGGRG